MSTRVRVLFAVTLVVIAVAAAASAQETKQIHPGKGGSPHVQSAWTVDGAKITMSGGKLVVPIGPPHRQRLRVIRRRKDHFGQEDGEEVVFVPLLGRFGRDGVPR